jgi:hypothetical protein
MLPHRNLNEEADVTDGTVLVDGRGAARKEIGIGVRCDAKDIPEPLSGAKPVGWWLAAEASYTGSASTGGETPNIGDAREVSVSGTAALAVAEGRIIGIVSADNRGEPALWFAWSLTQVAVQTTGSQGLLRKRPTTIEVRGTDGTLELMSISRLLRNMGSYHSGQEGSLLRALHS